MKNYFWTFVFVAFISLPALSQVNCTNKIVAGYMPDYRIPSIADYTKLTHSYFCFINPTTTGGIGSQTIGIINRMNSYIALANAAGNTKLIVVGSTNFSEMATSYNTGLGEYDYHAVFADTIRKYCEHYGFEGVDIDWEGLQSATERDAFTAVLTTLRDTLHKYNLLLSVTVGYGNYWGQWFSNAGVLAADWMQVMVYDQTGTWAASPYGNHSSYQHLLDAETYWTGRGISKSHIVMGLPFYGYKFATTAGGIGSPRTYASLVSAYPAMDSCANRTPCTDYTWFNGPNIIRKKVNYTFAQDFKGVFIWELGQDASGANSLLTRVWDEYQKACAGDPYNEICTEEIATCVTGVFGSENVQDAMYYDATQELLVLKSLPPGTYTLYCTDIMGRIVIQKEITSENYDEVQIPFSITDQQGVYFITVRNDNIVRSTKVVK